MALPSASFLGSNFRSKTPIRSFNCFSVGGSKINPLVWSATNAVFSAWAACLGGRSDLPLLASFLITVWYRYSAFLFSGKSFGTDL